MNSKYTYSTATDPVEIEVDGKWAAILAAEDKAERNAERRHSRVDHKFAPGQPVSIDSLVYEGEWVADMDDGICLIELSEDFRQALMALTELQRRYFVMNRLEGYSYAEIARMDGKTEAAIRKHVRLAIPLLKNFLA